MFKIIFPKALGFIEAKQQLFLNFIKFIVLLSFLIFMYHYTFLPSGGDENVFIADLGLINTKGWIFAIEHKISLVFMILVYPLTLFFKDYVAFRIFNFLLFLGLCFYFKKNECNRNQMFYYYFIFYSTTGWYLLGTNDVLFIVSLVIFFNETYKILSRQKNYNISLLLCGLLISFFTRQLIYVYLPVIFVSLGLIFKAKIDFKKSLKIPSLLLVLLIVINIPSILKNHNFSYDNKIPPKDVKSNWVQRQYLAQLMVNKGELKSEQHPTWTQTDEYLLKNGPKSLPDNAISSLTQDYKLTIIEFFKDFGIVIFQSLRQSSIMVLTVCCIFFYYLSRRKTDYNLYLPFICLSMIAIFSFIIISNVETRWLIPVFIMALVCYSDLEFQKKLSPKIIFINYLFMIMMVFYGTFRVLQKF
ncbi:MAG: hypothetical protein H7174_02760 [Flavobacterium sp.]|nr:hypothetical protein [Flavobacterium sp.]